MKNKKLILGLGGKIMREGSSKLQEYLGTLGGTSDNPEENLYFVGLLVSKTDSYFAQLIDKDMKDCYNIVAAASVKNGQVLVNGKGCGEMAYNFFLEGEVYNQKGELVGVFPVSEREEEIKERGWGWRTTVAIAVCILAYLASVVLVQTFMPSTEKMDTAPFGELSSVTGRSLSEYKEEGSVFLFEGKREVNLFSGKFFGKREYQVYGLGYDTPWDSDFFGVAQPMAAINPIPGHYRVVVSFTHEGDTLFSQGITDEEGVKLSLVEALADQVVGCGLNRAEFKWEEQSLEDGFPQESMDAYQKWEAAIFVRGIGLSTKGSKGSSFRVEIASLRDDGIDLSTRIESDADLKDFYFRRVSPSSTEIRETLIREVPNENWGNPSVGFSDLADRWYLQGKTIFAGGVPVKIELKADRQGGVDPVVEFTLPVYSAKTLPVAWGDEPYFDLTTGKIVGSFGKEEVVKILAQELFRGNEKFQKYFSFFSKKFGTGGVLNLKSLAKAQAQK